MKKILFAGCLAWSLMLCPAARAEESATPVSLFERKIRFENNVTDQIREHFRGLVDPSLYKILANAQITRKSIPQSKQVSSSGGRKSKNTKAETDLPGFEPPLSSSLQNQSSTTVLYEETDQLQSLNIELWTAPALPADQSQLMQDYIIQHWVSLDPAHITLVIKKLDESLPASSTGTSSSSLVRNLPDLPRYQPPVPEDPWQKRLPWILGAAGLLLILLALFSRRQHSAKINLNASPFHMNQEGRLSPASLQTSHKNDTDDTRLYEHKENFIRTLLADLIVGRSFLSRLDPADQARLASAFQHATTRQWLAQWMELSTVPPYVGDEALHSTFMQQILGELHQFQDLADKQKQQPFGFLSQLTAGELGYLLAQADDDLLACILRFLPQDTAARFVASLAPKRQLHMLERVADQKPDPDREALWEKDLRASYERYAQSLLSPEQDEVAVMEAILEGAENSSVLARKLMASHPEWEVRLTRYLLAFEDLPTLPKEVLRTRLEGVDNELLLRSLKGIGDETLKNFLNSLSIERARVLRGLMKSMGMNYSEDAVREARREMMRIVRNAA